MVKRSECRSALQCFGLLVEAEDPRGVPLSPLRLRPPRRAVVPLRRRHGVIELRRHRRHLVLGEHTLDVEEPRLGQEVAELLGRVVERERPAQVERCALTITEVDEAGLVDLTAVEQEAQKWLPSDEGLDRAAADLGAPGQLQAEGRRQVLEQLGETLTVQGDDERVVAAVPHFEAAVVRGQCHLLPVDLEGERREPSRAAATPASGPRASSRDGTRSTKNSVGSTRSTSASRRVRKSTVVKVVPPMVLSGRCGSGTSWLDRSARCRAHPSCPIRS